MATGAVPRHHGEVLGSGGGSSELELGTAEGERCRARPLKLTWPSVSMQMAMGAPANRVRSLLAQSRSAAGVWGTTERSRLVESAAQRQTSCVLSAQSMPTRAANGTGFCMGESSCIMGGRDMQSRTQRRRYGEPVARLSLSIRHGQRHIRRRKLSCEHRMLDVAYSSPVGACPASILSREGGHGKRNGLPVSDVEADEALRSSTPVVRPTLPVSRSEPGRLA
jgi:hypothetical protein